MRAPTLATRLLLGGALLAAGLVATAAPASAVEVADEAALRAAFADPAETTIVVTQDIDLETCGGGVGQLLRPNGAAAITLSGDATITQTCPNARVIGTLDDTGELTIEGLTITGGNLSDDLSAVGGGINWSGDVILDGATITGNTVSGSFGGIGGGVFASGTLAVQGSTISENTAGASGNFGGLGGAILTGESVAVLDSTISGNTAEGGLGFGGTGGAIFGNGDITIVGSTLSGNTAEASDDDGSGGNGGAIASNAALTVINSTVTSNVASGASSTTGGLASGGDLILAYSTVVGNSAAEAANLQTLSADPDFGVDLVVASVISDPLGGGDNCGAGSDAGASAGYMYADDASCNLDGPGDQQDAADPLLGPPAANGGPTLTRLPSAASPLLDAIPLAFCTSDDTGVGEDQRSFLRPQGTGCDIGAVEVAVATPPAPVPTPPAPTPTPPATPPAAAPAAVAARANPSFVG